MTAPSSSHSGPHSGVVAVAALGVPRPGTRSPVTPAGARPTGLPVPGGRQSSIQGTLALDLHPTAAHPAPGHVDDEELDRFAHRFAQVVVEVLGGDRGVQQLLRWTSEAVYADLVRRTSALQRLTPGDQRLRRLRAQVRSVRLFRPTPDSAEVSIHVRHGHRSRAIAARIEVVDHAWRCTALQFG